MNADGTAVEHLVGPFASLSRLQEKGTEGQRDDAVSHGATPFSSRRRLANTEGPYTFDYFSFSASLLSLPLRSLPISIMFSNLLQSRFTPDPVIP
jgi:hypothetical protein